MTSPTTDRRLGLVGNTAIKTACKAVSTTSLTLSGEQTVGGTACVSGDRVLMAITGGSVNNGIWDVSTAAWSRAVDFNGNFDMTTGTIVPVYNGASTLSLYAVSNTSAVTIGTTSITFENVGEDSATLSALLASTTSTSDGDGLVGVKRTFTGAVATTEHAWHEAQTIDLRADLSADSSGVSDCTTLFQAAVTAGNVIVPPGTWKMSADVTIPANRKIWVQKGATITNTGGRFTAYDVDNVEWQIDGWIKSVSMTTASSKTGWGAGERGFIEFGDNYSAGQATSGFWVHGTGKVSGDWTGTPNVSDIANQINRKGIACWNSKNVCVEGLEVFGFDGEAIYSFHFDTASKNIVFRNNYVHDTRFNALNFNAGANGGGCFITHNQVSDSYAVEISAGECSYNDIRNSFYIGVYTGSGAGYGPVIIRNNYINTVTSLHGIAAIYASTDPVTDVTIQDNHIVNAGQYGIYTDYARELTIKGNTCIGTGTVAGGYDIGVNHALRGIATDNLFMSPGASAQSGRVVVDANSFDFAVNPDTNVYLATTGSATPNGNVVATVASAAAVTLPVLGSVFSISGTTNITSMVATGNNGRRVTLIFQSTPTFTDGSNLKLSANLVATADDTITLVCDGTNWYEIGRSVN